jgi:RNA polymerase sigma-70 factor, ECF subfamily
MRPAAAHYLRRPGESEYRPPALDVRRIEGGRVAEINSFVFPVLFPAFGLPPTLDRSGRPGHGPRAER